MEFVALRDIAAGEEVTVRLVSDDDPDRLRELRRRGLVPGARLKVVAGTRYESPIEADLERHRVSVPLGLARAVFVEPLST